MPDINADDIEDDVGEIDSLNDMDVFQKPDRIGNVQVTAEIEKGYEKQQKNRRTHLQKEVMPKILFVCI